MLRRYQAEAVERTLAAIASKGSAVLQMPTGAGKTKTATEIIKRHDKPVLFICHRQEIERQASKAFTAAGIEHGIVSPRAKPDYDKPVQIASVATLARRIKDMPLPSLVIWDECHHTPAKSWARIREALAGSQHLGLTATPERLDGKGLSDWFDELVVGPSTRELIDSGWLSDFRYFAPSEPDLKGARLQAGDYAKNDLAKVMNTPVLIGDAIAEYQKNAAGKRALVFCASVEASQELVRRFNDAGVPALHVDGNTPTPERDAAVEALKAGRIKVLSNVEVFTEGFDLPAIDAVILLRPTKSLALFLQMIGRALRKAEGKNEALIFDHAGLWLDHDWFDLPIEWSMDGGARERRLAGRKIGPRRCPECHEVRPAREPVCACGYEFPTGREIGEYDGVLRELRGVVPEGWETKAAFARRVGVSWSAIDVWVVEGMPHNNGFIRVDDALEWVQENKARTNPPRDVSDPENYESITTFARRLGIHVGSIIKLIDNGLPTATNGWVNKVEGIRWVINNPPPNLDPSLGEGLYERPSHFANRIGRSQSIVAKWIKKGLPAHENGWIKIDDAMRWLNSRTDINRPSTRQPEECGNFINQAKFASRYGITIGAVRYLINKGLPTAENGWIEQDVGGEWMNSNWKSRNKPPLDVQDPWNYEQPKKFEKRCGIKPGYAYYYRKKGLPCASNGWVHVQRGMEWVRDNTDIEIPPEAWPKQDAANDNGENKSNAA